MISWDGKKSARCCVAVSAKAAGRHLMQNLCSQMVEPGRRNLPGPCGFLFERRAVPKECILVGFFESLLDRVESLRG
jgi:hypothetical protein